MNGITGEKKGGTHVGGGKGEDNSQFPMGGHRGEKVRVQKGRGLWKPGSKGDKEGQMDRRRKITNPKGMRQSWGDGRKPWSSNFEVVGETMTLPFSRRGKSLEKIKGGKKKSRNGYRCQTRNT